MVKDKTARLTKEEYAFIRAMRITKTTPDDITTWLEDRLETKAKNLMLFTEIALKQEKEEI